MEELRDTEQFLLYVRIGSACAFIAVLITGRLLGVL